MTQEIFEEKRDQWLDEVSAKCHEFALTSNLDFYVFQTPCTTFRPDLLIIGINPGGLGSYSEVLNEQKITKRTGKNLGYDTNTLVKKPDWETGKGSDIMRMRLSKVFNEDTGLQSILENTVMTNRCYFNTKVAKDLEKLPKEIIDFCRSKTIELLDILKPKNILFLGITNLKAYGVSDIVNLDNAVKKGKLNLHTVYAIPHYGAYAYYAIEKAIKMGKTLHSVFLDE